MAKKGDLQVTIKADSKEFDKTISNSTNQIRKFTKDTEQTNKSIQGFEKNITSLATGALTKMAGAIGAAVVSYEALNGIIESTDATADQFAIAMEQAKSSVDYFFTSIANGDFSNFWSGMKESIRLAREFAEAIDEVEDRRIGYSIINAETREKISGARATLIDPDATKQQKEEALKILKEAESELTKATEKIYESVRKAEDAAFDNAVNKTISNEAKERLPVYLAGLDQETEQYIEERKALEERIKAGAASSYTTGGTFSTTNYTAQTEDSKKAEKELALLNERKKVEQEIYESRNKFNNKELKNWSDLKKEANQYNSTLKEIVRTINREENKLNKSSGSGGTTTIKPQIEPIPEGSIAAIDKQISDLNKQLSLEIDPEKRKQIYDELEWWKRQKVVIEVEYKHGITKNDPNYKNIGTKDFSVKPSIDIEGDIAGMSDWFKGYQSNLKKMETDSISSADNIGLAFSSLGNIFGTLGSVTDDTTSRMLGGFQTILGGIGTLIPAIQALTIAEQAKAIAGATSSGASMPFPLNLVAIASGVAAVIAGFAQMSKIPKMADGGLVYGNTIAQVGEYPGASNNPEVIAPLSKLKKILSDSNEGSSSVDFRISGKDLVGVMNNYSSIKKKK